MMIRTNSIKFVRAFIWSMIMLLSIASHGVTNGFGRNLYKVSVGLPFSSTILDAPQISKICVNEDTGQDSPLTSIEVFFDTDISRSLSGASFTLVEELSGTTIESSDILVSWSSVTKSLTLRFPNLQEASLGDGEYKLTIETKTISANGLELDGDSDGIRGGNYVQKFHRLLGDASGNKAVDVLDGYHFRKSYGSVFGDENYRSDFDFNNDGKIDVTDKGLFKQNLRTELPTTGDSQRVEIIQPMADGDDSSSIYLLK